MLLLRNETDTPAGLQPAGCHQTEKDFHGVTPQPRQYRDERGAQVQAMQPARRRRVRPDRRVLGGAANRAKARNPLSNNLGDRRLSPVSAQAVRFRWSAGYICSLARPLSASPDRARVGNQNQSPLRLLRVGLVPDGLLRELRSKLIADTTVDATKKGFLSWLGNPLVCGGVDLS